MKPNKISDLKLNQLGGLLAPALTYLTLMGLLFGGVAVAGAGCLALVIFGDDFFGFPILAGSLLGAMGALGLALRLEKTFQLEEKEKKVISNERTAT